MAIVLQLLMGTRSDVAPVAVRRSSPGILIGMVVLSIGGLLATVGRSIDPAGSALVLVRLWYVTIVWFWTVRSATTSLAFLRRLLLAAVVGAVANASVAIFQDVSGASAGPPTWGRAMGLSDHFNGLGLSLALAIPVLAVWRNDGDPHPRWTPPRIVAVILLLAGLGASGSISAFGAALAGTATAVLAPRLAEPGRSRRRSVVPVVVAVGLVLVVLGGVVDTSVQSRFSELSDSDSNTSDSAESRALQAEVGVSGIVESPIVGAGFDPASGYVDYAGRSHRIHNFYLRLAYEAGIFGLLGMGLIIVIIGRQAWQLLCVTRGSPVIWIPSGLIGMLTVMLLAAVVGSIQYERIAWLPMVLISATYGAARADLLLIEPVRSRSSG